VEDKGNGVTEGKMLNDVERLTLQNISLQKQLLEEQAQKRMDQLNAKQQNMATAIKARLGIDISDGSWVVNTETGEIMPAEEQETSQ